MCIITWFGAPWRRLSAPKSVPAEVEDVIKKFQCLEAKFSILHELKGEAQEVARKELETEVVQGRPPATLAKQSKPVTSKKKGGVEKEKLLFMCQRKRLNLLCAKLKVTGFKGRYTAEECAMLPDVEHHREDYLRKSVALAQAKNIIDRYQLLKDKYRSLKDSRTDSEFELEVVQGMIQDGKLLPLPTSQLDDADPLQRKAAPYASPSTAVDEVLNNTVTYEAEDERATEQELDPLHLENSDYSDDRKCAPIPAKAPPRGSSRAKS